MRKCLKCGLPIGPLSICPSCGYDNSVKPETEQKNIFKKLSERKISVWNLLLILVCNLSLVSVIVNVCTGSPLWCHYAIFGMVAVYFIMFTCAAKSLPKFITRYRNTVVFINVLCIAFYVVLNLLHNGNAVINAAFQYFVPINITVAAIVFLFMLISKNVKILQVLLSLVIITAQSAVQVVFALVFNNFGSIAVILSLTAAGICLLGCLNIGAVYFFKFRNSVCETFRLWE